MPVQRPRFRVGDVPIYDEENFYSELKRELSKCRRVDRPLTLILIQVDDLNEIVELFGKKTREGVLWHVAEQAMASLREVDLVGMMSSRDLIALTAFASDKYGGGRVVARMRKLLEKTRSVSAKSSRPSSPLSSSACRASLKTATKATA